MTVSELRPYQREAVAAITAGLRGGGLGQAYMACGSGKTLVAQRAAEALLPDGGTVVVLVPSLALIAQTLQSWFRCAAVDLTAALAVCFDDTVADAPAHLDDLRIPVTTGAKEVREWLERPSAGLRLIVGTYLSAGRLAEAVRGTGRPLDLLVLDEAHHLAGRADFAIRRVVDQQCLPAARRLYMTATPRVDSGAAERHGHLSMDDTEAFGPVLFSYAFARGIAEGYLEDYRLVVVGVSDHEARRVLDDDRHEYVEELGAPSLSTLVAQAALIKASRLHDLHRVLTFHHRVAEAAEFARTLYGTARRLDATPPYAGHVHGEMDHRARDRVLDHLRRPPAEGWSVVSNSRCLGEGVDVPAVDGVLFAHPKRSAVDIVQAVGRALRPHPDAPGPSTIIVPLVLPEQDGEIGDLDAGDYDILWQVIRSLRAHDTTLGIDLNLQRSREPVHNPQLSGKITVVLPDGTAQRVLDSLTVMLVRQTTSPWWEGYGHATRYHADHGHLAVPTDYRTPDGFRLWRWLQDAVKHRRRGWLAPDRIEALDRLGITWEPHREAWERGFQAAWTYHAQHGDLLVPQGYVDSGSFKLGRWIMSQRNRRKEGTLKPERQQRLEQLGMVWSTVDAQWDALLASARDYRAEHGHLDVPYDYRDPAGLTLGKTLSHLRGQRRRGRLTPDRVRALDDLAMVWNPKQARAQQEWEQFVNACRRYLARPGVQELRPPRGWRDPDDGYPLASKITTYRMLADTLTDVQRALLNELAPARTSADAQADAVAAMRRFHTEHGHLRIPAGYAADNDKKLRPVLDRLRGWRRKGILMAEHVQTLEDLGIAWDPRAERWTAFLDALRGWRKMEPDSLPPQGYIDGTGYPLETRLAYYRQRAGAGLLDASQVEALLALRVQPSRPRVKR